MLGSHFFLSSNFVKGLWIVVQAFWTFKCSKVCADGDGGEVLGQALVKADSTFKRTVRFHTGLLFVPVVVVCCSLRPLHVSIEIVAIVVRFINQTFVL